MITRFFFILILWMGFNARVNGQHLQIQWQQCFGGSDYDIAYDVVSVDGGYIVAGFTSSSNGDISNYHGGESDAWIVRTDEYGNLMWEKTYGGTGGESIHRIFKAANSNDFYLVCASGSSDGDISDDTYVESLDYWIVKIDSTGNLLWEKIVGGNGFDQVWTGTATSDGGIAAFGWSASNDGDVSNAYGLFDMWMIKLDSAGEKAWDYSIGTSSLEYGEAIIETSDGGFLVGGASGPVGEGGNIDCTPHSDNAEAILFKLDSEGNEEWQQCYGGSDHESIIGLLEVEDGYLFSAYTYSNDGDLEGSGYHGNADIWLVKTDFEGNIVWQKCYGGSNSEYATVMFQNADEGYMVFGITSSKNGDVVGNHSSVETNYSIWVFKINNTGELLWQQCIGGISSEKIQFGVLQKSDHDYVIAGQMSYSPSYDVDCQNHQGDYEYWLFEVIDTTVSVAETKKEDGFNVYPNPAGEKFKVESLKFEVGEWHLEVYDLYGRKVKELQIPKGQSEIEVDAADWEEGMCLIIFKKEGKIVDREKLIVNRK